MGGGMSDLEDLSGVAGVELSVEAVYGILEQIDLDILNLVREGKLSALKYAVGTDPKASVDRGANLKALMLARKHYEELVQEKLKRQELAEPGWEVSQGDCSRTGMG
ncbi:MAG TPA: hypothetical protein DD473_18690 [Planctomycetaceae bacterium]|nr:hypothetical protein [Planctomycetaceae bacterium]